MTIKYTSKLSQEYIEQLEKLLYFNAQQRKVINGIESSIEKYGLPKISISDNTLIITLDKIDYPQSLYALNENDELIGLVIFFRESLENIVILHIAIAEDFSLSNTKLYSLAINLIEELKNKAKNIKGITTLSIYYKKDNLGKIKIK